MTGRSGQGGFTLIELLAVISLMAILMTLSAFAIRNFWFVRAFDGTKEEVVTQLRQLQERVVSETHPNVYGAHFPKNSTFYRLIRYHPGSSTVTGDETCTTVETVEFGTGVRISSGQTGFDAVGGVTGPSDVCNNALGGPGKDGFVFFFGRGTATEGALRLISTVLSGRDSEICVAGLTGRVYLETEDAPCP